MFWIICRQKLGTNRSCREHFKPRRSTGIFVYGSTTCVAEGHRVTKEAKPVNESANVIGIFPRFASILCCTGKARLKVSTPPAANPTRLLINETHAFEVHILLWVADR